MRTRRTISSSDPMPFRKEGHRSVLLGESIDALDIREDDIVLDATLGGAGHAREIARRLGPGGVFVGLDADGAAIARAKDALANAAPKIVLMQGNFRSIGTLLPERGITRITKVFFDLGWSSHQLEAGRGFSFSAERGDDPLLMTYADTPDANELTAKKIVNTWGEESLADVLFGWGGERSARRIARAICERREKKSFETARELAETISGAVPAFRRKGRLHPATKTFQALRIAVNDEIGALLEGLRGAWSLLEASGRIAVISFHSVEDREVKQYFASLEKSGVGQRVFKKPVVPSEDECRENPRARSAKLRVIEKTSAEGTEE